MSANSIKQFRIEETKEELKPKQNEDTDPLEDVLNHIGEFGRYQKFLVLCMAPFGAICTFVYFIQMFIAATPQNHWCRVPELQHLDQELRRNLTAPPSADDWPWERCRTYDTNWTKVLETLTPPSANTPTVPCSHGWEFQLGDIPYHTVVSERGWVCEYGSYAPTAQAMFFVGSIVGGVLFGWLADRYGRVPALVGSNMIGFVGGIASIFTTGLWDFIICRFLVGISYDSCFFCIYILVMEYVGPRYRTWTANLSLGLFFGGSCVLLPWLALWLGDWRTLLLVTTLPMLVFIVVPFVVPESARWLLSSGQISRMLKTLKRFERVNRTKVPQHVMDDLITSSRQINHTDESVSALLKSKQLGVMVATLVVLTMACAVVFDGLVRVSGNLGLDFFISFTLASLTEIFSLFLLALILDKFGRKKLTTIPLYLAGVLCLLTIVVPKGIAQVSLATLARFCVNMGFMTLVQWSTELLPTPVRASGSAVVRISGFVATAGSPFIVYSEHIWHYLPLLIQGLTALLAGSLAIFLPEMVGRPLPQNIAEGERLFNESSLCGKPEHEDVEKVDRNHNEETVT